VFDKLLLARHMNLKIISIAVSIELVKNNFLQVEYNKRCFLIQIFESSLFLQLFFLCM